MHGVASKKGALSVALVITRQAREQGLPLNPKDLVTEGGGQVAGLGKSSVQVVLNDHGIQRVLAEEGGRTSRGSIGLMRDYVKVLNELHEDGPVDLSAVEQWWIIRVREYFAKHPFKLRYDPSKSLRSIIHDVLDQAQKRQEENPGTTYAGTVLQHLLGAKLDLLKEDIEHHGASVADAPGKRDADFSVGDDVALHVTTTPGEALIRKCRKNIEKGLRPVIVTTAKGLPVAEGLASQEELADRIDVFEAEQFLAGNIYELGAFSGEGRRTSAEDLVAKYNEIVEKHETDRSLRIKIG